MISPFFEELSDNTEGVKFCKVDVDAQLEIAQECGIQAVSFHRPAEPQNIISSLYLSLPRCPLLCFSRMERSGQNSEVH